MTRSYVTNGDATLFVVGVVGLLAFQVFPFCALTHLSYRFLTQDSELTSKKKQGCLVFAMPFASALSTDVLLDWWADLVAVDITE